jgi:hypothetical protein
MAQSSLIQPIGASHAFIHDLQGLLLAPELLMESLDFLLILGTELLKLLLLLRLGELAGQRLQGEHWLFVGILGRLAPPFNLLQVQTPFTAIGAELGGIEPCGLQHHCERSLALLATARPSSSCRG